MADHERAVVVETADNDASAIAASNPGFLPSQPVRSTAESLLVRVVASAGVVGIGTAVGAVLSSQDVAGWVAALVVSLLCVLLAAILWRSRRL